MGESEKRGWTLWGCGCGEAKRRGGGRKQLRETASNFIEGACVCMGRGRKWGPTEPAEKEGRLGRSHPGRGPEPDGSGSDGMGGEVGPERG